MIKCLELAFQGVVASPGAFVTEIVCAPDMDICRQYYEESWRLAQFIAHARDAVHTRRQPSHEPQPLAFAKEGCPDYQVRPYYELQAERFSCFPMFKLAEKSQG